MTVFYEAGIQWRDWRATGDIILGRGINRQIRRAYGCLASRYRPGDRIFLMGYSRGAFAVRSLAGVIDRIGLLRGEMATERNVRLAWRHYRCDPDSPAAAAIRARILPSDAAIEMVGLWDTVKALGLCVPVLWRFRADRNGFHNHHLGHRHAPRLSRARPRRDAARPTRRSCGRLPAGFRRPCRAGLVSRLPLGCGRSALRLSRGAAPGQHPAGLDARADGGLRAAPAGGWRARFPQDVDAPSLGTWAGWGKVLLVAGPAHRRARPVGTPPRERAPVRRGARPAPRRGPQGANRWLGGRGEALSRALRPRRAARPSG